MPGADKTIRAGETQESQNRQGCDNQKRHHEGPPFVPALTSRIAGDPIFRDMSRVTDRS